MAVIQHRTTYTYTHNGSITTSPPVHGICPDTGPAGLNNNLEDLVNFIYVASFSSGYGGYGVTSGIEIEDSRFFGSLSCEPTGI